MPPHLADAVTAFTLVQDRYAVPPGLPCPAGRILRNFHFVEAKRWDYYLRYVARFNVQEENAGKVEAVTHSYETTPKIGVNKEYHTFATLVHESVHFFSHYEFRRAFDVDSYEGATEYLARSVLGDFGPRRDINGQNDMYAREIIPFLSIAAGEFDRQQLCQAYFAGDQKAILRLNNRLSEFRNPACSVEISG